MKITEENLAQNGWDFDDSLYQRMIGSPFIDYFKEWRKKFVVHGKNLPCRIDKASNTSGRDWRITIFNDQLKTVAVLDIATYEQIDKLLELLKDEN